jgi:RNase P subunit RPR2
MREVLDLNHKKDCEMKDWGGQQDVRVGKDSVSIKCMECGEITRFKKLPKKRVKQ